MLRVEISLAIPTITWTREMVAISSNTTAQNQREESHMNGNVRHSVSPTNCVILTLRIVTLIPSHFEANQHAFLRGCVHLLLSDPSKSLDRTLPKAVALRRLCGEIRSGESKRMSYRGRYLSGEWSILYTMLIRPQHSISCSIPPLFPLKLCVCVCVLLLIDCSWLIMIKSIFSQLL